MGIKVMTKVWEWSESNGNDRMVLLALADHADDDGVCFPGVARIAKKARISERTVQRCFKNLEAIGELVIEEGKGRAGNGGKTNLFTIRVPAYSGGGVKLTGGDRERQRVVTNQRQGGDTTMSPEPSVEPSVEPSKAMLLLESGETKAGIPESLNTPEFLTAWEEWEQHLKAKKCKSTPLSRKKNLAKCAAWGPDLAVAAINHSIEGNYQGLFEPRPTGKLEAKAKAAHASASYDAVWHQSIWLLCKDYKAGERTEESFVRKQFAQALRYTTEEKLTDYIENEMGFMPDVWVGILRKGVK